MFREYLRRTYQALARGRKRRAPKITRPSRPAAVRPAVEGLEDRALLSTLTLTNGALAYAPSSGFNNTLTISDNPATHRYTFVDATEFIALSGNFISPSGNGTHTVSFGDGNIGSITVNMLNQEFVVNIEQTLANVPLTVNLGGGTDTVNVSPAAHNLNNVQGAITVHYGSGIDSLNVYDQSSAAAQTFSMGASSVSRSGAAPVYYSGVNFVTLYAGSGNNTYNVTGTEANFATTLNTGNGTDTVNVNGTGAGGTFTVYAGGTGGDVVNVGNAGSLAGIFGTLTLNNSPSYSHVHINDGADNADHPNVALSSGSLTGLAPAPINFGPVSVNTLDISVGNGNNTYTVSGSPSVVGTTLNTGAGTDTVNVQDNTSNLNINGQGGGGNDVINLGDGNSLAGITGAVNISNGPSYFQVNVHDESDTADHPSAMVTPNGLTGLAAAVIAFDTMPNCVSTLNIYGGSGNNTYNVSGSQAYLGTTLNTGDGTDTVYVRDNAYDVTVNAGGSGADVVNVGNFNNLAGITGALTLNNPSSYSHVNINDGADNTDHPNVVLTDTSLTGLTPAPITFGPADLDSLTITVGNGNNTYIVANTQEGLANVTTLNTGAGADTVNVQATTGALTVNAGGADVVNVGNAGSVQGINGSLTIVDPPSHVTINVDDSADTANPSVTLDTLTINGSDYGRITGLAPAAIQYKYDDTASVTVQTGPGGATVDALATVKPVNLIGNPSGAISLAASDGDNTWNITGQNAGTLSSSLLVGTVTFTGATNLTGGNGDDTYILADGAGVDGMIDGGGGTNTLDYSAYSSTVIVDLQTGSATGVGGGVANIQNVTGGTGGGAGIYNILVGNGGNILTGGDGRRNLLVAGASASTLIGGNDDDILIGGTTAYDQEAGLVSLQAIMAYWSSTADDYATRVANLLSGNGVPLLDATMVTNNGGGNTLLGNHGGAGEMNLFYGLDPTQETTDYNPAIGEQLINC